MRKSHILSEDEVLKHIQQLKARPGVFLETSFTNSENNTSFLFQKPQKILAYYLGQSIDSFFKDLQSYLSSGFWVCGYFAYELGYVFEPLLLSLLENKGFNFPLAWFGVFKAPLIINHRHLLNPKKNLLNLKNSFGLSRGRFNMDFSEYKKSLARIKNYLAKGDTYQVNFTLKYKSDFWGDISRFYLHLRRKQPTSYSAFLNDGKRFVLSFSPELFFRIRKSRITTRPMKGTYRRGKNVAEDMLNEKFLKNDLKSQAENIMIVDLLRNDLGRIAREGTVETLSFFDVEKYPSLLQMTSTIDARLRKNLTLKEIFGAIFPSGSVTGAPKIRTMQIIEELEKEPRDVYTGSLGFIGPGGQSCFNVAIRTVVIENRRLCFGVGGGIVYDSSPVREYQECLLKANFLTERKQEFCLIETMLWEKKRFVLLKLHLERLKSSSIYFQIPLETERLKNDLIRLSAAFLKDRKYKVRVLVNTKGSWKISYSLLRDIKGKIKVKLSNLRVNSEEVFLYHKTTNRKFYDDQRKEALGRGFFEIIFANEKGELTEGTISNLFLLRRGSLFTPPLSSGVLPGVLRQHLLMKNKAKEEILFPRDIFKAQKAFIGNSVRGLVPVDIVI
ncbi:MAG: aminodeoxychorismate synthase component I [Candidatus Omnitrophica bacterium]|nr:aminodeoxychorismate synthase component I [Candidatus Omnitrophota bacterium]